MSPLHKIYMHIGMHLKCYSIFTGRESVWIQIVEKNEMPRIPNSLFISLGSLGN
jgi:hypothetical protein